MLSGNLLYSAYKNNEGKPLQTVISMLKDLYSVLPKKAIIRYAGSTGYGEKLMQTALSLEMGK